MPNQNRRKTDLAPDASDYPRTITQCMMGQLAAICERCGVETVFIYADAVHGRMVPPDVPAKIVYVTRNADDREAAGRAGSMTLQVPSVALTRIGQVKLAILFALARGIVRDGECVAFLSGIAGSGSLDTILVTLVGQEFAAYASSANDGLLGDVGPDVLERVIDIASELGREGREGKQVGALFVLGDSARVLSMTRPLILNPFRGYDENERNLLDPALEETVKELSSLDGAFIVRGNGVIETCGVYLETAGSPDRELPRGLGARHHAAAGITAVTGALAVTVSESTGTVTVFRAGRSLAEVEKPRGGARSRRSRKRRPASVPRWRQEGGAAA